MHCNGTVQTGCVTVTCAVYIEGICLGRVKTPGPLVTASLPQTVTAFNQIFHRNCQVEKQIRSTFAKQESVGISAACVMRFCKLFQVGRGLFGRFNEEFGKSDIRRWF